eukprot:CAMPEP_0117471346 /NCGR_PEP_ID=MMETSP0784-20121206/7683_1 /TAXON_ID=39447 /ORGANISM="" /LENGTH=226 /DNA_ID=CAMNT_0005265461 /DNA_START=73 /DNA_END=750 /DNA_ORIENTATION=-
MREAVERFLQDNPVVDKAAQILRSQAPEVQQLVLDRGSLAGTANPSGALISRVNAAAGKCGLKGGCKGEPEGWGAPGCGAGKGKGCDWDWSMDAPWAGGKGECGFPAWKGGPFGDDGWAKGGGCWDGGFGCGAWAGDFGWGCGPAEMPAKGGLKGAWPEGDWWGGGGKSEPLAKRPRIDSWPEETAGEEPAARAEGRADPAGRPPGSAARGRGAGLVGRHPKPERG